MAHGAKRDFGFLQWTAVGFLVAFGLVGILFVWPLLLAGVLLLGVMLGRGPDWTASLGAFAGVGLAVLAIGLVRGAAPGMWVAVGCAVIFGSAIAFWWLRCRPASA